MKKEKLHTKLDDAADEIRVILKKYDIAGICFLHTPGFGNYMAEFSPSYSGITLEENGFRVRAKAEDFNGDVQARDKMISDSLNMLHVLTTSAAPVLMNLMDLEEYLNKKFDAVHGPDIEMYKPPKLEENNGDKIELEEGEFSFRTISEVVFKHEGTEQGSAMQSVDLRLEVSENLDRARYLNEDDLPHKDGIKAASITLVAAINTNIYTAHHAKQWDSAEHLRWVIDTLQKMFVENAEIRKGYLKL
jgi:hypothetical protein